MEQIVCGQLDRLTHVKHIIRDYDGLHSPHACLFECHNPTFEPEAFHQDVERAVDLANVHQHSSTCHKSKKEEFMYRYALPQHLKEQTDFSQIEPFKEVN